jgi:DNA-binding NarL/FixJ family response regulator
MRTSSVRLTESTEFERRDGQTSRQDLNEQAPAGPAPAGRDQSADAAPKPIVLVGVHLLSRQCLARVMGTECNVPVVCFSTLDEWLASGPPTPASLVVLCHCGCSKVDALNEVEQLCEITEQIGRPPIVVLSDNEDPDLIVQLLGKNVRGYVPTSLSISVAMQAMKLVRAGGVFVPASSLIAAHRVPASSAPILQMAGGLFTERQAAVVEALRRGKANKIIAYELKMRESTVKVHVRNIMKKLHATNRTQVAYLANRLVEGEEPCELTANPDISRARHDP